MPESGISEKHLFPGTKTLIGRETHKGIEQLTLVHSTNGRGLETDNGAGEKYIDVRTGAENK